MKRNAYLLVLSIFLLSSCSVKIPMIPSIKFTESVDYSRYGEFFITESNSVSFDYKPIASVQTTHIQGVDEKTISLWTMREIDPNTGKKKIVDDVYSSSRPSSEPTYTVNEKAERITLQGTLDDLVGEAEALGANGIINLVIKPVNIYGGSTTASLQGYEVSGMAISR